MQSFGERATFAPNKSSKPKKLRSTLLKLYHCAGAGEANAGPPVGRGLCLNGKTQSRRSHRCSSRTPGSRNLDNRTASASRRNTRRRSRLKKWKKFIVSWLAINYGSCTLGYTGIRTYRTENFSPTETAQSMSCTGCPTNSFSPLAAPHG